MPKLPEKMDSDVCSIRIMFPTESDEQAIEAKKRIKAALSEIPDARIQFTITSVPISPIAPVNMPTV